MIFVTKATKDDLSEILNLDFDNFSNNFDEKFYLNYIEQEKILLAKEKDKTIGYILFEYIVNEAEIYKIAVSKKHRKLGIGSLIMKEFLNFMSEKSADKIFLEVRESNFAAINLYRKFGFVNVRTIIDYYKNPKENGFMMIKEVNR
ncbi:MAG: ribosomal protein S18-alanine N-acetyltransferase [Peptoniphilaceae bacterium]|uniref:ribosomal protein S18-alanine N-acetyltransferase n=1 Tax=Parvimonas sp. TaxID=1944660 RepID=UPI0025FCF254|nr:ribosomal protein S18-alanine N-acetyltransferase [Parvimonas sp.]MCI5997337.1 ribosomal protein S18-alanine N-acetyltransferase [Parvimonas sp.]MDD7765392.1 ribosomal protein S18-alanine N-acetyltransferase [Peptoniphilaceae bacterium]MDY3050658.1 ribosomal protein S18-alanine N-acetyltransferase [Parvimonas sp.]